MHGKLLPCPGDVANVGLMRGTNAEAFAQNVFVAQTNARLKRREPAAAELRHALDNLQLQPVAIP